MCIKVLFKLVIIVTVVGFIFSFLPIPRLNVSLNQVNSASDLTDYFLELASELPKFNMSYIHYNDKASFVKYIDNTKGSITEVAPNYFYINRTGDLVLSSTIDVGFVEEMHDRNIKVVPYLSNDWNRTSGRLAISKRRKLCDEIAKAIEKYNLDGINIDIENLTEKDRERHTEFIKMLRRKLPEDKVLAVAVAANPNGLKVGWQGCYDYEELGEYCDYLMIMAYDEHYGGSAPGPVASIDFVENSIKYALERVPKEKIVLGIPFYGRMWRNNGGMSGQGISLRFSEELISKYGGSVIFSGRYLCPKATVTIKSNQKRPIINGNEIRAGTYTIWYENERSLKHKLSLVKKYDLKGTGSWSLGQETSDVWSYYSLWLNGYYYPECQGHWAQNSIIFSLNNKWLSARTSKNESGFLPEASLTRGEAAAALVSAFQLKPGIASKNNIATFNDISSHWAKKDIEIAVQHRIVMGRGDGTFAPDEPVTREEMSVMLDRALAPYRTLPENLSRGNNSSQDVYIEKIYVDVNKEVCPWSYDSINRMVKYGIFTRLLNEKFNPKENISRGEMSELLFRIWESKE